jgi:medium-chain acyl-[acyl-carrier-protein] hydrolase
MGRVLQADLAIMERYECAPAEPLECPILAFGGLDDAWVDRGELDAWRQHTQAEFSSTQFPGDHFYFRAPEVLQSLLEHVRKPCLEAARRDSPESASPG